MLKIVIKTTTIVLEANVMACTRLIANRVYKIVIEIDGTTRDFTTKCNRVAKLDNELFIMFDIIRRDSLEAMDCPN